MTVVVGYIPTPEGLAALDRAMSEAAVHGLRLVVVNTGRDGNFADPVFATPADLDAIDEQLTAAGIEHEVRQPTAGASAAEAILDVAENVSASLVVIGIRRRSPVGKLWAGSTSQSVLLGAGCPVLAVKAEG
jgi:nucleotide-binding universal stress UspA family protein